jgi:hypothetical protein
MGPPYEDRGLGFIQHDALIGIEVLGSNEAQV